MAKSTPSSPPVPNPIAIAGAQGAANVNTAAAQAALNNTSQVTPYGSSTFKPTGSYTTPATGTPGTTGYQAGQTIPTYTQTVTLNPTEQATLTQQQQLAKTLAGYGDTIANSAGQAITTPLDFSKLQAQPTGLQGVAAPGTSAYNDQVNQAIQGAYQSQIGLIQPGMEQKQRQLTSSLENAGIPQGSEAWNNAQNLLASQQAQQTNALAGQSVGAGQAEQAALQQEALAQAQSNAQLQGAARTQGITEQQLQQTQPINELAALLQGAPAIQNPNVQNPAQTGVAPTDLLGAQSLSQAARNVAYQGQVAAQNSNNSALSGLLGSGLAAALVSDRRAKIIGSEYDGALEALDSLTVSRARYKWEKPTAERPMIMADEVAKVLPDAVIAGMADGYDAIKPADLIPVLIAAVKQLSARVRQLEGGT